MEQNQIDDVLFLRREMAIDSVAEGFLVHFIKNARLMAYPNIINITECFNPCLAYPSVSCPAIIPLAKALIIITWKKPILNFVLFNEDDEIQNLLCPCLLDDEVTVFAYQRVFKGLCHAADHIFKGYQVQTGKFWRCLSRKRSNLGKRKWNESTGIPGFY